MLPYFLIFPLWFLFALVWPLIQTLHALRLKSDDTQVWLFYWIGYVVSAWFLYWFEWIIYAPFAVLSYFVDVYYEAQLIVILYLVLPNTSGAQKLKGWLAANSRQIISRLTSMGMQKLGTAFQSAMTAPGGGRREKAKDRPGTYDVICDTAVTSEFVPTQKTIIKQLAAGESVNVLEVTPDADGKRLRARIEHPAGWISVCKIGEDSDGKRWAARRKEGAVPRGMEDNVMATAVAAGCDPTALFQGFTPGAATPQLHVSDEEAWEAMALLESQFSSADDPSEDPGVRQASQMLRSMMGQLVQADNPAMLSMAQMMVPDIGKIWANDNTREYLRSLLTSSNSSASAAGGGGSGAAGSSSSSSGQAGAASSSTAASGSPGSGDIGNATGSAASSSS